MHSLKVKDIALAWQRSASDILEETYDQREMTKLFLLYIVNIEFLCKELGDHIFERIKSKTVFQMRSRQFIFTFVRIGLEIGPKTNEPLILRS